MKRNKILIGVIALLIIALVAFFTFGGKFFIIKLVRDATSAG